MQNAECRMQDRSKERLSRGWLSYTRHGIPAFTLAELLVAMLVLIIILGITGAIYKASSDAVSQTNATTEIQQKADAIKKQLQADLSAICKDGYLFLVRRDFDNLSERTPAGITRWRNLTARSDQVVFWRTGQFQSYDNATAISNLGFVFYSHAVFPAATNANSYGDNASDGTTVNRWLYSRLDRLYIPSYVYQTGQSASTTDIWNWSFGTDQRTLDNASQQGATSFTTAVSNWLSWAPPIDNITRDYYRILAGSCGDVRIRFLLPTNDADHDGVVLTGTNESDQYQHWPPDNGTGAVTPNIWMDLPAPGASCARGDNLTAVPGLGIVCFAPNTDLWPKALEFTIRIYDPNLSVSSEDDSQPTGSPRIHGGMTYTFIVPLAE